MPKQCYATIELNKAPADSRCHLAPICQRCNLCVGCCVCPPVGMRRQDKPRKRKTSQLELAARREAKDFLKEHPEL